MKRKLKSVHSQKELPKAQFGKFMKWGFKKPVAKSSLIIPSRSYNSVAPKISSLKQSINHNYAGETGIKAFFPEADYGEIFGGMDSRVKTFMNKGQYKINDPIRLMDGNTRFWLGEQKGKDWDSWYRNWQNKNQDMFPEIAKENLILNRDKGIWETNPDAPKAWATDIPNFLPKNYSTNPLVKQSYIESGAYNAKNNSLINDQIAYGSSLDKSGFDAGTIINENINVLDAGLNSNRTVVQLPMPNGKTQFMMRSSGNAGKDFRGVGSSEGIWSPFPGFHTTLNEGKPINNWFVKGDQNQYDNFYGSKSYEDISKKLSELEINNQWDMSNQGFKSLRTTDNPNGLPSLATPAELKIFKETPGNKKLNTGLDRSLIDTQQQGGQLDHKQLGGLTRKLAKSFTPKPSLLPTPTISTIPYTKQIGFNPRGQLIPQQHMTSGKFSSNPSEALDHIYGDGPMWFAPTGDTRYINTSLDGEHVSGLGKKTIKQYSDFIGNTGRPGIDQFPYIEPQYRFGLFDNERMIDRYGADRIIDGMPYHKNYIQNADGSLGDYVTDINSPVMLESRRTRPGLQNKIEGIFNPDSKIKVIDGKPSRLGHSLEGSWDGTKIGKYMDEGYDIVQIINQFTGEQLENILLPNSKHKFKVTKIDDMDVDIDNPEFKRGGNIPHAQMGGSLSKFLFNNASKKLLNKFGLLKTSNVDKFLTQSGFSKNQKTFFNNTLDNNPQLFEDGLINTNKWQTEANNNVAKMHVRDVVNQKQNPYIYPKSMDFQDGMDGLGVHGYFKMGSIPIKPQLLHFTMPELFTSASGVNKSLGANTSGFATKDHDIIKVHGDGTFGWARGFANPNDKSQFLLTELQNDLVHAEELKLLTKAYKIKDPGKRAIAIKKIDDRVSLNNTKTLDMNLINDLRVDLNMYEDLIDNYDNAYLLNQSSANSPVESWNGENLDDLPTLEALEEQLNAETILNKNSNTIDELTGKPYHKWELEAKAERIKKEIAAAQRQMVNYDLLRGPDNLQLSSILNEPYKRQQNALLNYLGTKGYTSLGIPDPQTVSYIQGWDQFDPTRGPMETYHVAGTNYLSRNGWDDLGLGPGSDPSQGNYGRMGSGKDGTDAYYKELLRTLKKDVNISDIGRTELGENGAKTFKWNTLKNIGGKDYVPFKQDGGQPEMETASIYDIPNKDGAYEDQSWLTKFNHGFSDRVYNNSQKMNMNAAPAFGGLGKAVKTEKLFNYGKKAYEGVKNWMSETSNNEIAGYPEGNTVNGMNMGKYGGQTEGYALNRVPDGIGSDNNYEVGGQVYRKTAGSSYQEGGSTEDTRARFETFIQEQESSWDYIKSQNSAILKPDGKTYYKMYEGDKFYPYYHKNADGTFESEATIGFGRKGSDIFDDYKKGVNLETAEDWRSEDIDNSLRKTKIFIDANYGDGAYKKLSENEKFMLTDYTYNLGKLSKYPSYADAIVNKDVDKAMLEYIRNDKPTSEGGKPLFRNEGYLEQWLQPWINKTNEDREAAFAKSIEENAIRNNLLKDSNPQDKTYVAPPVIPLTMQKGGSVDNFIKQEDYTWYQSLLTKAKGNKEKIDEINKKYPQYSKMKYGDAFSLARDAAESRVGTTNFQWNGNKYTVEEDDDDITKWRDADELNKLLLSGKNSGNLETMINDGTLGSSEDIYQYLFDANSGNRDVQRVMEAYKKKNPETYLETLGLESKSDIVNKLRTDRGIYTGEETSNDESSTTEWNGLNLLGNDEPQYKFPDMIDANYAVAESTGINSNTYLNNNIDVSVPETTSRLVDAYLTSNSYNKGTKSFNKFAKTFNANEKSDFNLNYLSQFFGDDKDAINNFTNYVPGKTVNDEGYNELYESINISKDYMIKDQNVGNESSNFQLPGGYFSNATTKSIGNYEAGNMPNTLNDRRMSLIAQQNQHGQLLDSDYDQRTNMPKTWKQKNLDEPWDNFINKNTNAFIGLPASMIDWGGDVIDGTANVTNKFFTGDNLPGMANNTFTKAYDNPNENNLFWAGLDIASILPQVKGVGMGLKGLAQSGKFGSRIANNAKFSFPKREIMLDGVGVNKGIRGNYNQVMGNIADNQVYNNINQFKNQGLFNNVTGSTKYTMPSGNVVNLKASNLQFNPNAAAYYKKPTSAFANPSNYKWPGLIGTGIAMESNTDLSGINSKLDAVQLKSPKQTY